VSARLTPAQARVVDAMRDGSYLERSPDAAGATHWRLIEEDDYLGCEYDRGEVRSTDVDAMVATGAIVEPPRDPWHTVVLVLASSYREAM